MYLAKNPGVFMERKKLLRNYVDVIAVFLASRVCFIVIIFLAGKSISELPEVFDGGLYNMIAENGYNQVHLTNFFPMIPLIIRYLGGYALIAINQICLFISMVLLKKLLENEHKTSSAGLILLIFAFSPVSYFSFVEYTESIFFVLSFSAFYLFVKNKLPWLMGILLGLSVFTRNTGSIVFFALFIGMVIRWIRKETGFLNIIAAYVPATIISILYPVYLQFTFGSWKVFLDVQFDNWYRERSNLFKTYCTSFKMLFTDAYEFDIYSLTLFRINEVMTILITAFLLCLCVKEIRKLKNISLPSIVSVLVIVFSIVLISSTINPPEVAAPTRSFYRYYLGMFPAFTLLYDLNPKIVNPLVIIFAFSGIVISYIFFKGIFFY